MKEVVTMNLRDARSKQIEFLAISLVLALSCIFWFLGLLSLSVAIWSTCIFLIILVFLSWYRFDGGSHPVFLFLGLLLIFQGGRLLGYIAGALNDPFRMELETWIPFEVPSETKVLSLFSIALSAACIYLLCRASYRKTALEESGREKALPALYIFFILTFPFMILKNILYLRYMMAHGGYYAIYTDYEGVVSSAGFIVRGLGILGTSAFMLIYLLERSSRRITVVTTLYMVASIGDLLIGYRGKVYTLVLTLWYLRNPKQGKRFPLPTILFAGLLMASLGVVILAFREQHAVEYLNPMAFVAQQGVSLNVTEAAIEYRHVFEPHGVSYIVHDLLGAFVPVMDATGGKFMPRDLSLFLNPFMFAQGNGTGSDYLAQLYIAGKLWGVLWGSIFVGAVFAWLQRVGKDVWGGIAMVCIGQYLIYIPRGGILEPLSQGIRIGIPMLILLWTANYLGSVKKAPGM